MSALTDFILARVVEDEAEVDALLGEWGRLADGRRLERQCEAYRRIVEECYVADCIEDDLGTVMERARATPYVGERIRSRPRLHLVRPSRLPAGVASLATTHTTEGPAPSGAFACRGPPHWWAARGTSPV